MSKGAFQTRLGQMGEIPNFQQTPPMAYTGNYFMLPKPNYLPVEKQAMARVQQPMSIQQPIANIMAEGSMQQPMAQQPSFQQQVPGVQQRRATRSATRTGGRRASSEWASPP